MRLPKHLQRENSGSAPRPTVIVMNTIMKMTAVTVIAGNTTATATDNRPLFLKYQLY